MNIKNLEKHLIGHKENLIGDWIKNNSSYDGDICKILSMKEDTVRYWDARWFETYIEFKKGKSIWLDLVRYSEILLKVNSDASKETFSLFFIPNDFRDKINEIIGVKTNNIIKKIGLSENVANQLIDLKKIVPRSLNAQASLTVKDIKTISDFIV